MVRRRIWVGAVVLALVAGWGTTAVAEPVGDDAGGVAGTDADPVTADPAEVRADPVEGSADPMEGPADPIVAALAVTSPAGLWVPAGRDAVVEIVANTPEGSAARGVDVTVSVGGVTSEETVRTDADGRAQVTVPGHQVPIGLIAVDASVAEVTAGVVLRGGFLDVTPLLASGDAFPFFDDIWWLGAQGVSTGWALPDGAHAYRPYAPVARDAMAAFLYRAAHPGEPAPSCTTAPFQDVVPTTPFCGEIAWLADTGISTGWRTQTGAEFRPHQPIERAAIAAFLRRMVQGDAAPAGCVEAPFSDVSIEHEFCADIAWLAAAGLTTGWQDGTFRPAESVNRDAMAAFLHRHYGAALRSPAAGTVELDEADITQVSGSDGHQVLTVRAGATLVEVGGILVAPITPTNPDGTIGRVVTAQAGPTGATVYELEPATLADAYTSLRIIASNQGSTDTGEAPAVGQAAVAGTGSGTDDRPDALSGPQADSGWDCDIPLSTLLDVAFPSFAVDLDMGGLLRGPSAAVSMSQNTTATLSWQQALAGSCGWGTDFPSYPLPGPLPLTFNVGVSAGVSISAEEEGMLTGTLTASAGFTAGLTGVSPSVSLHRTASAEARSVALRLDVAVSAAIKAAGVLGVELAAGPFLEVEQSYGRKFHTSCLDISGGLAASGSLVADIPGPNLSHTFATLENRDTFYRACDPVWTGTFSWSAQRSYWEDGGCYGTFERSSAGTITYALQRDSEGDLALLRTNSGAESRTDVIDCTHYASPQRSSETAGISGDPFDPFGYGYIAYQNGRWTAGSVHPTVRLSPAQTESGAANSARTWYDPVTRSSGSDTVLRHSIPEFTHQDHLTLAWDRVLGTPAVNGRAAGSTSVSMAAFCASQNLECSNSEGVPTWNWLDGNATVSFAVELTEIPVIDP